MTDREKLALIKRLALNLSPLDFNDEKVGLGAAYAYVVATELICEMEDDNDG